MLRTISINALRFILLILLQVLLIDNLQLSTMCNPYIYVLFLLTLPVDEPRWLDVILGFLIGLFIDMFSNTLGLHCFAGTLVGYLRYYVIKLFVDEEMRTTGTPGYETFGAIEYIKYVVMLVTIHHATLFALEAFTLTNGWWLIGRVFISSLVSSALILVASLFDKAQ
ncbi:MAG: rod shape-determining protein MreD [Paludibacteraceae bacterium]|nr:rod shape-determining protein MreD [Paludibacteraceae bacterium]